MEKKPNERSCRNPFLDEDGKSILPVRSVQWVHNREEEAFLEKVEREEKIRLKKRYIAIGLLVIGLIVLDALLK